MQISKFQIGLIFFLGCGFKTLLHGTLGFCFVCCFEKILILDDDLEYVQIFKISKFRNWIFLGSGDGGGGGGGQDVRGPFDVSRGLRGGWNPRCLR